MTHSTRRSSASSTPRGASGRSSRVPRAVSSRVGRVPGMAGLVFAAFTFASTLAFGLGVTTGAFGDEASAGSAAAPVSTRAFPHELHERLFPSCKSCHLAATGSRDDLFRVEPNQCNACHDGTRRIAVEWSPPEPRTRFFLFDHEFHAEVLDEGDGLDCTLCHEPDDPTGRMDIVEYRPDACFDCHGLDTASHYEPGGDCETCHLPLAANADVTVEQISQLPMPQRHHAEDFLQAHGGIAEKNGDACATCHARESCERCHANAAQVAAIQALDPDPRVAELNRERAGAWPAPPSHAAPHWPETHGAGVDDGCANCHAQETCTDCHLGVPRGADQLAPRMLAGMPVLALRPLGHSADFVHEHGGEASTRDCAGCHAESFCTDCHRADRDRAVGGYHPPNFVVRHATGAWSRDPGCADCHSTEGFCRSCHEQSGLSPTRSRANGYHDSEPMWIINHGNAARQGLDACASCHQQADCLRCHSARTGWGVNPHGPDFDPDALDDASLLMCTACHPRDFLRR